MKIEPVIDKRVNSTQTGCAALLTSLLNSDSCLNNINFCGPRTELEKLHSTLSNFTNKEKINLLTILLQQQLISTDFYETQIQRYEVRSLQAWCKYSLFKQLINDPSKIMNKIEQSPLSTIKNSY